MANSTEKLLLSDSSTLINFLRIDRADLLTSLSYKLLVTDVVRAEITRRYQSDRLEDMILRGVCEVVSLTDLDDLRAVRDLKAGGLGDGESVSIVAAHKMKATLAIDDGQAIRRAKHTYPRLHILTTQQIMVMNIQQGALTIEEADAIKHEWQTSHRFTLKITSFAELI